MTVAEALLHTLAAHAHTAARAIEDRQPVVNSSEIGFVEGVWRDPSDVTWLVGWMAHDAVFDRPVIIVDADLAPAGFACAMAERPDLGPSSKAFVGVLTTTWEASPNAQPQFHFTDGSGRYVQSLPAGLAMSRQQIAPIVRDILERTTDGHRDALLGLFRGIVDWVADDASPHRLHVDEFAVLPGFGAFVTGWALSPSKRADRFTLKAGSQVVRADEGSVMRFDRPDTSSLYANVEQALETAGFVALFRDVPEGAISDELILKATWHDGTSTNGVIAPAAVRTIGLTSPVETVRRFYPSVEAEAFFLDFARHAAAMARARAKQVRPHVVEQTRSALLFGAPEQRSDLFLMFDTILRHAGSLSPDWGIAIVARSGSTRPVIMSLFDDLRTALGRPCSLLFTVDATPPTTDCVARCAAMLGANRIGWVAPHVSLDARGWKEIGIADKPLLLLCVDDPTGAGDVKQTGSAAFVADLTEWQRLNDAAEPRMGGIELPLGAPAAIAPHAATALGRPGLSRFEASLNRALDRAHG